MIKGYEADDLAANGRKHQANFIDTSNGENKEFRCRLCKKTHIRGECNYKCKHCKKHGHLSERCFFRPQAQEKEKPKDPKEEKNGKKLKRRGRDSTPGNKSNARRTSNTDTERPSDSAPESEADNEEEAENHARMIIRGNRIRAIKRVLKQVSSSSEEETEQDEVSPTPMKRRKIQGRASVTEDSEEESSISDKEESLEEDEYPSGFEDPSENDDEESPEKNEYTNYSDQNSESDKEESSKEEDGYSTNPEGK